jgi:hypothetical protein
LLDFELEGVSIAGRWFVGSSLFHDSEPYSEAKNILSGGMSSFLCDEVSAVLINLHLQIIKDAVKSSCA